MQFMYQSPGLLQPWGKNFISRVAAAATLGCDTQPLCGKSVQLQNVNQSLSEELQLHFQLESMLVIPVCQII